MITSSGGASVLLHVVSLLLGNVFLESSRILWTSFGMMAKFSGGAFCKDMPQRASPYQASAYGLLASILVKVGCMAKPESVQESSRT